MSNPTHPLASLQHRVYDWTLLAFGQEITLSRREAALRNLEESLELAQALGLTPADVSAMTTYVFSRPVGDIRQEIGGAFTTLCRVATTESVDLQEAGEQIFAVMEEKRIVIRRKWEGKPLNIRVQAQE